MMSALRFWLKRVRNDLLLAQYTRKPSAGLPALVARTRACREVICVVAFEKPQVIEWLLTCCRRHLRTPQLVVFDNSRTPAAAEAIARICARFDVPCLKLPANPTRHANRSHGLAMTWIYRHYVRQLEATHFGFIDHDLLPFTDISLAELVGDRPFHGLLNQGRDGCWNLWAGYCFYRLDGLRDRPLNFLYDFSRGLDTGGRNWEPLYRHHPQATVAFPRNAAMADPAATGTELQIVDGRWVHLGGASYNDHLARREDIWRDVVARIAEGRFTRGPLRDLGPV